MSASISVVTVTLNAELLVPRLFASLRAQDDKDFDFVVVDGASRDGTWTLVEEAQDIVTSSISEVDCGLYDALNKAVGLLKSDYYIVLGADDVLYPDAIRNFKTIAQRTSADVVVAGVKKGGNIRRGFNRERAWLGHSAMVTSHSVGMLIRADLHHRFGKYSMRYPLLADGLFIKKICTDASVKTVQGDFVAGEFCTQGLSNRSFVRALCENWQIQVETGEQPVLQYLLFQARLIKNLPKIIRIRKRH